jgi:hypothetical protein
MGSRAMAMNGCHSRTGITILVADTGAPRVGLEHDPEKWEPVFGKDHAQTKS